MHRPWTRLAAFGLVLSIAIPANALAAGPADRNDTPRSGATTRTAAATVTVPDSVLLGDAATTVRPAPAVAIDWQSAITTAVASMRRDAMKGTPRSAAAPRTPRAQYGGGGGKGAMVSMILTTVVTLGATVYMLKYLRDQQNAEGGEN